MTTAITLPPVTETKLISMIDGLAETGIEMSLELSLIKELRPTPETEDDISNLETQLNLIATEMAAYEADLEALRKGA